MCSHAACRTVRDENGARTAARQSSSESIAESVEAHAIALDSLGTAIERIERRLERADGERRDSRVPKARSSEPPRSVQPPRLDDTGDFSLAREPSDEDDPSISGSSIRGSIGDMSLSTVLAMIEIERRSGRLEGTRRGRLARRLRAGGRLGRRQSRQRERYGCGRIATRGADLEERPLLVPPKSERIVGFAAPLRELAPARSDAANRRSRARRLSAALVGVRAVHVVCVLVLVWWRGHDRGQPDPRTALPDTEE